MLYYYHISTTLLLFLQRSGIRQKTPESTSFPQRCNFGLKMLALGRGVCLWLADDITASCTDSDIENLEASFKHRLYGLGF